MSTANWRRLAAGVLGAAALLAAVAACTEDEPAASRINTGETRPAASEAQVRRDFLGYWDALEKAHEASNPEAPELKRHTAGTFRKVAHDAVDGVRGAGLVLKGPVSHDVKVKQVDAAQAVVEDCPDSAKRVYYVKATGKPFVPQPKNNPSRLSYTLVRAGDLWVIQDSRNLGPC
jgi:hypothetical protein